MKPGLKTGLLWMKKTWLDINVVSGEVLLKKFNFGICKYLLAANWQKGKKQLEIKAGG